MKNLLFVLGILCLLVSCKKESVEPVPGETIVDSVNTLPTFVYTSKSNDQNQTVYRFSYYPDGLLKKVIQYDSVYNPDQKDSTLYLYNSNHKVIETTDYSAGTLKYKTEIIYNLDGNIETVSLHNNAYPQQSIKYEYIYAAKNDVAYVLKYDATNTVTDSIAIDDDVFIHYFKPAPDNFYYSTAVNGYAPYNPEHCFKTPGGVYYDTGVRNPGSPDADQWGYVYNDNSLRPVCIDKTINFQYEVAMKFIDIGSYTDYPEKNYYITPAPLQYCVSYKDANTGHANDYKFDQDNRLVEINGRFNYYTRSGSPIPGGLTTIIRY
ncbi:MAG: hypothetical protein ACTHJT_05635 [Cytophaga sp.]|uniref:hypothetical protein n=1 Tax=Cytophaga sp. TaxID=29535 RepID=UPI003F806ABA